MEVRKYIAVNVPKGWKPYFDELMDREEVVRQMEMDGFKPTYSGLGCWIIYRYLMDYTDFRFEHFNLDLHKGAVRVADRKRRMIAEVYFK